MVYKRFSVLVVTRVVLLLIILTLLATIFGREDLLFNQLILGVVLVIQIYELIHFVSRTNRDLAKFLLAVKDQDLTISFSGGPKSASFSKLHESFKSVIETIREAETEKNAQYQFLQLIIDHVAVGIITFDATDKIQLMNKKAQEVLSIPKVKSWQLLQNTNTAFFEKIRGIDNEQNQLVDTVINGAQHFLSVNISQVRILEEDIRILVFKDIKSDIDKKEIEAWHKLIRILTHEIMNSVTPVASLTDTLLMIMSNEEGQTKSRDILTDEQLDDIRDSIQIIKSRSAGLLKFVEDYRKLTKIPVPKIEEVDALNLMNSIEGLLRPELNKAGTNIEQDIEPGLKIQCDPKLIEQVLINLVTNSKQALKDTSKPKIKLSGNQIGHQIKLHITDNGPGIPEDKMDKIFIPFFTTKPDGSGIGLSLSRQIMNLHGGALEVASSPGNTSFSLVFPINP